MSTCFLLVCEGPSDIAIIEEISLEIGKREKKKIDIRELSPQLDATSKSYPSHGWTEVRNWCKKHGNTIPPTASIAVQNYARRNNWEALLAISKADGIIIQLDTDIAEHINGNPAFSAAIHDRKVYCRSNIIEWLGIATLPPKIYLVLATHSTENWILALHDRSDPVFSSLPSGFNFEDINDPIEKMIALGYPTNKWGKLIKRKKEYSTHAKSLAGKLDAARLECLELDLLCQHLESI